MANPRLNFTYDEWMSQTSKAFFMRSAQLKALDILVDSYIKTPSDNNLRYLKQGFSNWKASKGAGDAWFKSKRNDKSYYAITNLNAQLDGTGDTDAAFGVDRRITQDMISARLGLLYLFGRTAVKGDYFTTTTSGVLDLAGAGMGLGGDLAESAKPALEKVSGAISAVRENYLDDKVAELDKNRAYRGTQLPSGSIDIKTKYSMPLEELHTVTSRTLMNAPAVTLTPDESRISRALMDGVRDYGGRILGMWDEQGGQALRQLSDFLVKKYLSSAVNDIAGGSLAIVPNLVKLIDAGFQRYQGWLLQRRTTIQAGAPTAIVDGVLRAMDIGLSTSLYGTLKSGAQLGMTITSAGASTIVNFVFSVVEILVKMAWRLTELRLFKSFLVEARGKWEARGARPIHERPIEFNRWFRPHVERVPLIAALSLNCGFCHSMTFLQMFDKDGTEIKPERFAPAMAKFTHLKQFASKYIEDTGFELISNDGLVEERLQPRVQEPSGAIKTHILEPFLAFCG